MLVDGTYEFAYVVIQALGEVVQKFDIAGLNLKSCFYSVSVTAWVLRKRACTYAVYSLDYNVYMIFENADPPQQSRP